jgi:integrase
MAQGQRIKLTKSAVEAIPPGPRDTIVWDSEVRGFGVKVTPKGRRSYFVYYRTPTGQQRRPTIGIHGQLTPDQARRTAREWLADAARGVDVSADRQAGRKAETVADLAARYLTDYAEVHKKPRSIKSDRANIANHVLPLIGDKKVKDVTRADIDRLKLAIRDGATARNLKARPRGRREVKGGEGAANRTLALLSKMFACAMDWGLCETNPARGIRKFKEHRKDRFLDRDEIARLHEALDAADADGSESPYAIAAIRFLLFTGLRPGEVMELTWGEVDLARQVLRLDDTKTGGRVVPLNEEAFDIIRQLPADGQTALRGPGALVFPSLRSGGQMTLTRPWQRIRERARISGDATLHTLRHTFASWAVMGGLQLPQVGALLGHRSAQTTLRYADHVIEAVRDYSKVAAAGVSKSRKPI